MGASQGTGGNWCPMYMLLGKRALAVALSAVIGCATGCISGCASQNAAVPQIAVSPEAAARSCIIHACSKPAPEAETAPTRQDSPAYARQVPPEPGSTAPASDVPDVELGNAEISVRLRARAGAPLEITSFGDARSPHGPRVGLATLASPDGTERQLATDRVSMFTSEDGSATVTVSGHDPANALLHATTTLKLARGDRAVLVSTTLENTGAAAAPAMDVRDRVTWAGARPFVPGRTRASTAADAREFSGPYVGGISESDSVAFTTTDGEIKATLDKEQARLHVSEGLALGARSQKSFDRVLVVGERPDSSSVVTELMRASGLGLGTVHVEILESDGRPPPYELVVRSGAADALTVVLPRAAFDVELPEGAFTVRSKGQPENAGVAVTVRTGIAANVSLSLAR